MKKFLILSFLISFSQFIYSQDSCSNWSFGTDFNFSKPLKGLQSNGFGDNYGANFDFIYHGGKTSGFRFQPGFRLSGGVSNGRSENFVIDITGNPSGESTINNTMGDLKFLGRIITDQNQKFKAYMEGFIGFRISGASRRISLDDNSFGDEFSSERLTTQFSEVIGFGGGFLIEISDKVDLNLRGGIERSSVMVHYDVVSDPYPVNAIETNKAINASYGIGVFINIYDCEDEKIYLSDEDR